MKEEARGLRSSCGWLSKHPDNISLKADYQQLKVQSRVVDGAQEEWWKAKLWRPKTCMKWQ